MEEIKERVLENLYQDFALGLVVVVVTSLGILVLLQRWKLARLPFALSLPVFLIAGTVLYFPFSPLYIRSDGEFYQRWGFALASSIRSGAEFFPPQEVWPGKGFWPSIIALMSLISGPATWSLIALNAVLLSLTVVLLQKATFELGGLRSRWTIILVFFTSLPTFLFGPSLLRESIFWLGVSLGVLGISLLASGRRLRSTGTISMAIFVLLAIRPDAGVVLAYSFVASAAMIWGFASGPGGLRSRLGALAVLAILATSFAPTFNLLREDTNSATIVNANKALSSGDVVSAFKRTEEPSSSVNTTEEVCSSDESLPVVVLCKAATNFPQSVFGPFPWEYGGEVIWWIAGLSTLHFWTLLLLAWFSLAPDTKYRWEKIGLFGIAAVSMLMFASILTNYGILIRFRVVTELLLTPLALIGLENVRRWFAVRKHRTK